MTTEQRIRRILNGARDDLARVRSEPEPPPRHWTWPAWADRQDHAQKNIIELRTAHWLGLDRLSHSETTLCSRALGEGERRGLWWRVKSPAGRTWGIELREREGD